MVVVVGAHVYIAYRLFSGVFCAATPPLMKDAKSIVDIVAGGVQSMLSPLDTVSDVSGPMPEPGRSP
jgi:hypothetical protein